MREPFISLGFTLIVLGLILLLLGIAPKFIPRVQELHPLLYVSLRVDGTTIGTSPLAIILISLIYALLFLAARR